MYRKFLTYSLLTMFLALIGGMAAFGTAFSTPPPAPTVTVAKEEVVAQLPPPVALPKPLPTTAPLNQYRVSGIFDGDTIEVTNTQGAREQVRLAGINAPELAEGNLPSQCFALEAAAKITADLNGKDVLLAPDPAQADRDPKQRLLRYISFRDGTDYNSLLVAGGYAKEMNYHSQSHSRQAAYRQAEQTAEQSKSGFWSLQTCGGDVGRPGVFLQRQTFASAAPPSGAPVSCASFTSRLTAQRFYEFSGGPFTDPHQLDILRNGQACAHLPF